MNYTEFMNAMLCEIRGQVDAQVRTELYTVTKNNGTRRTGILFKQEDSNLAPTIYLEEFYQKYLKGQQVPDLADSICSIYQEIRVKKTCDCQNLFDFNHVKEHIVYKLIRRDANEELLKKIPYEPFLDLAVVYYIQIDNTRFGSAAIQIRNEHLRYWRVEKEENPPSCREEYTADLSGADPADCALYVCGDERAVQSGGSSDAVSGFPGKGQGDDQRGFLYPAKQYP